MKKNNNVKFFLLFMLLLVFAMLSTGCGTQNIIMINKDVCREPGTYCHTFIVDGGTANLSFVTVINGTFNYSLEDV